MTTIKHIVAFDVGGANIKLASNSGLAVSRSFAMWKYSERLADELASMLHEFPQCNSVVATTTGELADCFANKQEGVQHIVAALETAVASLPLKIYLTDGRFVPASAACEAYQLAAASNWHALAAFVATHEHWRNSLLIDIGSTTCDVIPIVDGLVAAAGKTDLQRLLAGELVYVGAERTSLASLTDELPYRGQMCPIARELFATTLDVQLVLQNTMDRPQDCDTADGRPATLDWAVARMGRCICADEDEWNREDAATAAKFLSEQIAGLLQTAIDKVIAVQPAIRNAPIVVSGHGEYLLNPLQLDSNQTVLLREQIGEEAARAAPAYALARLAERIQ